MGRTIAIGRPLIVGAAALVLSSCASAIAERGFDDTARMTAERIGQRPIWVRDDAEAQAMRENLDALLAKPLGPDDAVRVALFNNRGLQVAFAEIGVGAEDRERIVAVAAQQGVAAVGTEQRRRLSIHRPLPRRGARALILAPIHRSVSRRKPPPRSAASCAAC